MHDIALSDRLESARQSETTDTERIHHIIKYSLPIAFRYMASGRSIPCSSWWILGVSGKMRLCDTLRQLHWRPCSKRMTHPGRTSVRETPDMERVFALIQVEEFDGVVEQVANVSNIAIAC